MAKEKRESLRVDLRNRYEKLTKNRVNAIGIMGGRLHRYDDKLSPRLVQVALSNIAGIAGGDVDNPLNSSGNGLLPSPRRVLVPYELGKLPSECYCPPEIIPEPPPIPVPPTDISGSDIISDIDTGLYGGGIDYVPFSDIGGIRLGILTGLVDGSSLGDNGGISLGILTGSADSSSFGDVVSGINSALHFGSLSSGAPFTDGGVISLGVLTGLLVDTIISTSGYDSGSADSAFYSGSLVDVILSTSGYDSGSADSAFYSGSLIDVILSTSGYDSGSADSAFYSGSLVDVIEAISSQYDSGSINLGLLGGLLS